MILASMGNAVMDMAAPMKSTASVRVAFSENKPGSLNNHKVTRPPRMKGAIIPAIGNRYRAACPVKETLHVEFHPDKEHVQTHP